MPPQSIPYEVGQPMGRGTTKTNSRARARAATAVLYIVVGALLFLMIPSPVAAAVAPDDFEIKSVIVSHNLNETGDMLFTIHYEVNWDDEADIPDDPADETLILQLLDPSSTVTLAAVTPYPFVNSGYGEAVASFYFDATQATVLGLTWETNYIIRLTTELNFLVPPEVED